jgi:phosphate transport system permease protein
VSVLAGAIGADAAGAAADWSRDPVPEGRIKASVPSGSVIELVGSMVAGAALVWVVFSIAGLDAPFGQGVCSALCFFVIYGVLMWRLHGILRMKDALATVCVWTGALIALVPLVSIMSYVLIKGGAVLLAHFPHFIVSDSSAAGPVDPVTKAGVGAAVVGTLEQVGITTLIAAPIAILTAIFLNETRNGFARTVQLVVDAMTGTPEIIAGLFVYLLWVLPRGVNGKSGVAASMALAVMMLPFVTRAAQEVLRIVPGSLREAALALGAPRWRVVLMVVVPTARAGLVTVTLLGVARAVGETAAVLFTAGGSANAHFNWNPFHGTQIDLPLYIVQFALAPSANENREAWGGALVLVLLVLILFSLARLVGSSRPGRRRLGRRRRGSVTG